MEEQRFELSLELQGDYRFLVDFGRDDLPPRAWGRNHLVEGVGQVVTGIGKVAVLHKVDLPCHCCLVPPQRVRDLLLRVAREPPRCQRAA